MFRAINSLRLRLSLCRPHLGCRSGARAMLKSSFNYRMIIKWLKLNVTDCGRARAFPLAVRRPRTVDPNRGVAELGDWRGRSIAEALFGGVRVSQCPLALISIASSAAASIYSSAFGRCDFGRDGACAARSTAISERRATSERRSKAIIGYPRPCHE